MVQQQQHYESVDTQWLRAIHGKVSTIATYVAVMFWLSVVGGLVLLVLVAGSY